MDANAIDAGWGAGGGQRRTGRTPGRWGLVLNLLVALRRHLGSDCVHSWPCLLRRIWTRVLLVVLPYRGGGGFRKSRWVGVQPPPPPRGGQDIWGEWFGWVLLQSRTPPLFIILAYVGGHRASFEKKRGGGFTVQSVHGP